MPASRPAERPLDAELLRGWPLRHEGADKIERGTVLVIGGSVETPGAAVLAGIAALRMGAGRLQIATAPELADQIAVAVPEARVVGYDDLDVLRPLVAECDAVVVGPGIVGPTTTQRFLRLVLGTGAAGPLRSSMPGRCLRSPSGRPTVPTTASC